MSFLQAALRALFPDAAPPDLTRGGEPIGAAPRSPKWGVARKVHLHRNPVCIACKTQASLEVHHIVPFWADASKELEPSNLCTLCSDCHFTFGHLKDWRAYNPSVLRDAEEYRCKLEARAYDPPA